MQERLISAEQCPAVELLRNLRNAGSAPPVLTLDSDVMESGGSIVGRLSDRRGRPVWLAFVSEAGAVHNLTDRLTEQSDGSATFSFGLNDTGGGEPTQQLLIAVAVDNPLIAAAAAADGAPADTLLPLIEAEIAGRNDTRAGAALAGFELRP